QLAADRAHGRFPQPVDRQPLDQQGELRARGCPRDRALHHAVGRALHAGHTRVESGLELARVEMPPLPLPVVVDRARGLAFGTRRRRALGAGQPHVHGPARDIQLDPFHRPRRLHPQDRRVQLPVPHRPTSSASSAAGTIAGGVSDGHVTHTRPGRAIQVLVPSTTSQRSLSASTTPFQIAFGMVPPFTYTTLAHRPCSCAPWPPAPPPSPLPGLSAGTRARILAASSHRRVRCRYRVEVSSRAWERWRPRACSRCASALPSRCAPLLPAQGGYASACSRGPSIRRTTTSCVAGRRATSSASTRRSRSIISCPSTGSPVRVWRAGRSSPPSRRRRST